MCLQEQSERDALQDESLAQESRATQQLLARYWQDCFAPRAPLASLRCTEPAVR